MAGYIIATASTADLPREYLDEHGIPFISYTYTNGSEIYEDDCREETRQSIYRRMRAGEIFSTSMINVHGYYTFFRGLMERGGDVVYLDMSRKMSQSYVNAGEAARQVQEEFPEQKLYLMDTLCISGGLGKLVDGMVSLKEQGKSFEEVVAWGEENKLKIMHRFTVDDLSYLKRGGRVSNAAAMVGALLAIKPVLYVPDDGTLTVACKVRGRRAALLKIVEGMKKDMGDPDGQEIHILHADCLADAEFVRDEVLKAFPTVGKVVITSLGVVIGAHCGPGLFTIFYYGSRRQP